MSHDAGGDDGYSLSFSEAPSRPVPALLLVRAGHPDEASSLTVKNQHLPWMPSSARQGTEEEHYQETANSAAFPENAGLFAGSQSRIKLFRLGLSQSKSPHQRVAHGHETIREETRNNTNRLAVFSCLWRLFSWIMFFRLSPCGKFRFKLRALALYFNRARKRAAPAQLAWTGRRPFRAPPAPIYG